MRKKKLPYQHIKIPIEIFKTNVVVLITPDIPRAAKAIRKWFQGDFEEWDSNNLHGRTLGKEGYGSVIWLKEPPKNPYWLSCLHHEVHHVVSRILERIKTPLTPSTEEVYAYLGEYIFHEILSRSSK